VLAAATAPASFRAPLTVGTVAVSIALCGAVTAAAHYREDTRLVRLAADESARRISAVNDAAARYAWQAKQSEHRRSAAMAAFAGAAGRMQAMSTAMLAELREMENRHADPDVLADLLRLDHRTAQTGRLADSVAVLAGARTGRRWAKPIAMESILRGAMGRVAGYQRIRLRAVIDVAVAGHAAEGVMHALAELLDNACNFSPPTTEVHVYAAEVPAGVVLTIEDSGLVMSESALRRAEISVAGHSDTSDLSSLTGTRLGLAVVGHLARKHGLTVSFRPSAIGGTAVVVVLPRDIVARTDRPAGPAAALPSVDETTAQPAATEGGLPRRHRGQTLAAAHPEGLDAVTPSDTADRPGSPRAFAAFQRTASAHSDGEATSEQEGR
jgi:signal transduction histidine kinase